MWIVQHYDRLLFLIIGSIAILAIRYELGLGGRSATFRALVIGNLPWIAAGIGHGIYPERDIFGLFDLRLGVVAYLLIVSFAAMWVALLRWLFVSNGAELLAQSDKTRVLLNLPRSAATIKFLAVLCVAGGVLGVIAGVIAASGR